MDSFELLSIPRYMGTDSQESPSKSGTDPNKSELISKLINQSKARKKLRLSSETIVDNNQDSEEIGDKLVTDQRDEDVEDHFENDISGGDETENDDDSDEKIAEEANEETPSESFPVIGSKIEVKTKKVITISEKWLTQPIIFDGNIESSKSLEELSHVVDKSLISLLNTNGIHRLFPVQHQVIPYLVKCFNNSDVIRPKDVLVCSPTGSGKTLAFVLPIIQYLQKRVVTRVRVLVVLPVRDLAIQVFQVFQTYCKQSSLKVGLVVGHKSFADECHSIVKKSADGSKYHSLVDILVATPGKLVDLIQRAEGFDLTHLEVLVLDESDRMMAELQFNWLQEIESAVFDSNRKHHCFCSIESSDKTDQRSRFNIANECSCYNRRSVNGRSIQKILFSATLSTDPEKLKFVSLFQPILFKVSNSCDSNSLTDKSFVEMSSEKPLIPNELKEFKIISTEDRKPLIVWYLMEVLKYRRVLCFTGSVESSHRLHRLLKEMSKLVVTEYSSRLNAKKREKLLSRFANRKIDLIICSDIFARGIDIDGVECVICYDPPRNETQYIHRIGRTARAGNKGTAVTLLTPKQLQHFTIISRRVHQKKQSVVEKMIVKESHLKPMAEEYEKCLKKLSICIKSDRKKKIILKRNFRQK